MEPTRFFRCDVLWRLAVLPVLLALPGTVRGQFSYTTNNDNTLTITGYTGPDTVVTIPSTINVDGSELPVTGIGASAFAYNSGLSGVIIPEGVISIGASAFIQCYGLTDVAIPDSVATIEPTAFYFCSSLTNVTFGNGLTNLGYGAFDTCALTSVVLPDSLSSLGHDAFASCSSLTNVNIPPKLSAIPDYAFMSCLSLPGITIPKTITSIGQWAFNNCGNLTNVSIPASVTNIGVLAFESCGSLTAITAESNTVYSTVDGVLFDKGEMTLIQYPGGKGGDYVMPEGVRQVLSGAFVDCYGITSVTVPASLTAFGDWTFEFCFGLKAVYFRGNAPSAGASMFYGDTNTVYYLPGTLGWGSTYGGQPTAPWFLPEPFILNNGPSFGVKTNGFGFTISWATNTSVEVEACTDLVSRVWVPVQSCTLTNGSAYFVDAGYTNYAARFYRLGAR